MCFLKARNIDEYNNYIQNMPLTDVPEVFGLHKNADISYQVNNRIWLVVIARFFILLSD